MKINIPENTIYIEANPVIDYRDLALYAKSYPDKLVSLFMERLVDDDMEQFTRDFYDLACEADRDGPAFEEWRVR